MNNSKCKLTNSYSPIHTYRFLGVAKKEVKKSEHCIAYTGSCPPAPEENERSRPGEAPMKPTPIRIETTDRTDKLHPMSRINLGKVWPIEDNIRVKDYGRVHKDSLDDLMEQFRKVNQERNNAQRRKKKRATAGEQWESDEE